jgi:PAS domain S-box-containing protein
MAVRAAGPGSSDDFSSLFEFLPIGAYRTTPDGRQLRANPALVRLNGCASEEELLGLVGDIGSEWYVDPQRRAEFKRLMEDDGRVVGFESEIYRQKTRERVWVRENAHVIRDAQGVLRCYEGTVEEITERVQEREELRRSQEQIERIVSLVPGAVYRMVLLPDGGRRISYISEGLRDLFGREPADLLRDPAPFFEARHPEDRERMEAEAAYAVSHRLTLHTEFRLLLPDGRVKWVEWLSAPAPPEDGLEVRVGVMYDITTRKTVETALQRSQQQLEQVVRLIPGVVFRLAIFPDGKRRYTYVSDHVRDLYGLEPAEVLADGNALTRFRHPDDAPAVAQQSAAAIAADEPLHYEVRARMADGSDKWIQVISTPAPPEDGCRVRVGMLFDITERKRAEAAVAAQAELWKSALDASGDGVWDWRVQDGVEILSPQCKALYGFAPDELPDTPDALDNLTHPDDLVRMAADRNAHFAGQSERYVNEHRVRCKDGQWKWVLSRGLVISRDARGRPLRMVGTHTDITAAKQAEALRTERDRAAAADMAKSQFLSRVSHELRTPLNAILGFAQLLELEPGGGERQQVWNRQVLASGRHLLALMDDILDMSSVQTGHMTVLREPVALRPVIDEAWAMVHSGANEQGVTLVDDLPAAMDAVVLADRKRVKQIISNLLSNAVKYNRPSGWVRLSLLAVDQAWLLAITDSGPGLDEAQQSRLFNAFDRLGAERGPVPGTGLGLALSRQLAHAMDGDILVRSRPGEGSTFTLRLPRARADQACSKRNTATLARRLGQRRTTRPP